MKSQEAWLDAQVMRCFRMPVVPGILGRSSTMRAAFVSAIAPARRPSAHEVRKVLEILGMSPDDLRCAYCGDHSTEWDHLNALVKNKKPTGYPSSIRNLVPSCGKCNQSRGSKPWREWMVSSAARSPKSRGVANLADRLNRLAMFEKWAECKPVDLEKVIPKEKYEAYWAAFGALLKEMEHADKLARELKEYVRNSP